MRATRDADATGILRCVGGLGLVEALREQRGEIAHHAVGELVGGLERKVRGRVVALDACDQLLQALLALRRAA